MHGSRAAFESVWFGSLGLERQTTLSSAGCAALCDSGAAAISYPESTGSLVSGSSSPGVAPLTKEPVDSGYEIGAAADSYGALLMRRT